MKALLPFFFASMIHLHSYSQDSVITYTAVVKVDNTSKDELYLRAREWLNAAFKGSLVVLQINDREMGELAVKGYFTIEAHPKILGIKPYEPLDCWFTGNIWVKDGKYKFRFTDFTPKSLLPDSFEEDLGVLTTSGECPAKWHAIGKKTTNELWKSSKEEVNSYMEKIITDLKRAMAERALGPDF